MKTYLEHEEEGEESYGRLKVHGLFKVDYFMVEIIVQVSISYTVKRTENSYGPKRGWIAKIKITRTTSRNAKHP